MKIRWSLSTYFLHRRFHITNSSVAHMNLIIQGWYNILMFTYSGIKFFLIMTALRTRLALVLEYCMQKYSPHIFIAPWRQRNCLEGQYRFYYLCSCSVTATACNWLLTYWVSRQLHFQRPNSLCHGFVSWPKLGSSFNKSLFVSLSHGLKVASIAGFTFK